MHNPQFVQTAKSKLGRSRESGLEETHLRAAAQQIGLEAFGKVLSRYLDWKKTCLVQSLFLTRETLAAWLVAKAHQDSVNWKHGSEFNPFSRIAIKEIHHSRLIGDLLNPSGSHGQGALFLDAFLRYLKIPYLGQGVWNITVETGRVDIMLWREKPVKSAVIIENKSNDAGDRPNQIYRYWHQQLYQWDRSFWDSTREDDKHLRNQMYHVVYLPTDGGKRPAPHSLERPANLESENPHKLVPLVCKNLSLSALMELWMQEAMPLIPPTNTRLRVFLAQYQELWNL